MKKLLPLLMLSLSLPALALTQSEAEKCQMSPESIQQIMDAGQTLSNYLHNNVDDAYASHFYNKVEASGARILSESSSCDDLESNMVDYSNQYKAKVNAVKKAQSELWKSL